MKNRFRILLPLASFAAALTSLPAAAAGKEELVEIDTTLGNIVVRLAPDRAPITVKNFLTYVREGFYKDTIFHRVIPGFMIQGGGFTEQLREKPTHDPIPLEARGGMKTNAIRSPWPARAIRTRLRLSSTSTLLTMTSSTLIRRATATATVFSARSSKAPTSLTRLPLCAHLSPRMNDVPVDVVKIVDVKVLP